MIPALLWRRFASIAYDSIVVIAIWMIVGFVVAWLFGIESNVEATEGQVVLDPVYSATMFMAMVVSAFLFFAWFWTHSGQTIGMMAWKIRVCNADGSAISWIQSMIRFAAGSVVTVVLGSAFWQYSHEQNRIIGGLLYLLYAAFWAVAWLQAKTTLTDRLSRSMVARYEKEDFTPPA